MIFAAEAEHNYANHQTNEPITTSAPSLYVGCRICLLETSTDRTAGFVLSGMSPPPYKICKIEKDSPAEKAGLQVNDVLLSVNEKSVINTSYKESIEIIREALKQKTVQLTVNQESLVQDKTKRKSQSSTSDNNEKKTGYSRTNSTVLLDDQSYMVENVVQQYQSE